MGSREELRQRVNDALKARVLTGLIPDSFRNIQSGLSSGSLRLNVALSGNPFIGYVWGRIVEIYGPEQSGKTTLTLHAVKESQHLEDQTGVEIPCLFIDAEHALDVDYARSIGIDLNRIDIHQPDNGEQALNVAEQAIREGYKLVVVDSVAALTPQAELNGDMGDAHIGLQARLLSQACRKLTGIISSQGALILFINQIRMKIGVMFGNPETTSGGNALKFYSSYRLDVRSPRGGKQVGKSLMGFDEVEEDKVETGIKTKVKVVKNKVFPPHRSAEFIIKYGEGIDRGADIISFLEWANLFKSPGSASKIKGNVITIPSKKKQYTAKGLIKVIDDPEVQSDIIELIKRHAEKNND